MTTVFKNGRIFTAAAGDSTLHTTLVVDGEKVVYVGSNADAYAASGAQVVDLGGSVVLPGLIDAHTHMIMFGASLSRLNCLGMSVSEVQDALRARRAEDREATMLLGRSFLYDALGAPPNKALLDAAVPDIPVFIEAADLHSVWLNSAALKVLNLTRDTPDPEGGELQRDADGELTGILLETALTEMVWPYLAAQLTPDNRLRMLEDVFDAYLATGVTGCIEMALMDDDLAALEAYIAKHGQTPIRVACHWMMRPVGDDAERAEQVRTAAAHRDRLAHLAPWFRVVGIKVISDGTVDGCTAFLKEPYPTGKTPGPIWSSDALTKIVVLADSLDLQIAVHAIGDAASEQALDAFEAAIKANGEKPNRRHRMEHLEVITQESVKRMARLGVIASLQPVHADPVYLSNWRKMLGYDARTDRAFPWTEFVDANAKIAFGSDAPTAPHHCFPNLYTATTRRSGMDPKLAPSTDPAVLRLDRFKLGLELAVRLYSAGAAYSMHMDHECGSLERGKSADFCVIDFDPFRNGVETLREAQEGVKETWVAGKQVWQRK